MVHDIDIVGWRRADGLSARVSGSLQIDSGDRALDEAIAEAYNALGRRLLTWMAPLPPLRLGVSGRIKAQQRGKTRDDWE